MSPYEMDRGTEKTAIDKEGKVTLACMVYDCNCIGEVMANKQTKRYSIQYNY